MRRHLRLVLAVAAAAIVVASCAPLNQVRPPGDAPLRYRDEIFTSVTKTTDIAYGSAPNTQNQPETLLLDMYRPVGDAATSRPAIVWVHGGSFCCGDKGSAEIVDQANVFAKKGFVNVSINYRLMPGGCSASSPTNNCITAIINAKHDAQAAVRFLRANAGTYGIDANRISIGGSSAGAITALNVGYDPTEVGSSGNPGFSSGVSSAVSLSGARILGAPGAGDAPALLFHGTSDVVVPYQWGVNTVNDARAAGLTAYLTAWEGGGHVPYVQHRTQILDETTNFLYWTMDLKNAAT
jgi:acetyl esterase/lipase